MHPRNIGDFDFQEAKFNWISVLPPFHGVFSQGFSCILSSETLYAEGCNCRATRLSLYIGGSAGRAHFPSVLPHLSLLTWAALGLHLPSKALAYQSLLQAPFSRELRLGEAAYCLDGLQDPLRLDVHGEGRQSTPNISARVPSMWLCGSEGTGSLFPEEKESLPSGQTPRKISDRN